MLPSNLCIDANVFIASLMPHEAMHTDSLDLIRIVLEEEIGLWEPELVITEVISIIRKKVADKEVLEENAVPLIEHIYQLPILLQWQDHVMKKAFQLAGELNFRNIYDCSYLAVAMQRDIPLVTLDDELAKRGKKVYPKIYAPSEVI